MAQGIVISHAYLSSLSRRAAYEARKPEPIYGDQAGFLRTGTTPDSHVARPVLRQRHTKCHSSVLTAGRLHEAFAAWAPVPNFFRRRGNKHGEFDMRRARRRPHAGYSATRRTIISKRLRRHPDSLLLVRTQAAANRRGGNFGGRDTHSVMASQSSAVIVRSQTLCIGFALAPPRV